MNSKCAINGKNKRLIIASIIFTMAIIMCGNGIISNTNISKKTTKKVVIQKEIVDGVEIKILADKGVFPQDAKATIKKIDKESDTSKVKSAIENSTISSKQKIKSVYSYDITIKDSKGNELQPDTSKGEVLVAFKDIKEIDKDNGKNVQVWHVKDDLNKAEKVKDGVEVCKNNVGVKVQHFSIYAIAELGETTQLKGAGTSESPYLIKTADDLIYMRDTINDGIVSGTPGVINGTEGEAEAISAYYQLSTNNIVINDWDPICPVEDNVYGITTINNAKIYYAFMGNFDGKGNKITINSSEKGFGLFGEVGKDACIRNLVVSGSLGNESLKLNTDRKGMGGIAELNYGTIQNCILKDLNLKCSVVFWIGGIAAYNDGEISNCKVEYSDDVNENIKVSEQIFNLGGVVGENFIHGKLLDVSVYKQKISIKQGLGNNYTGGLGGIVGKNEGRIESCFIEDSSLKFTEAQSTRIGGSVGWLNTGTVKQIYCINMTINCENLLFMSHIGGLLGCCENGTSAMNGYYKGTVLANTNYTDISSNKGKLVGSIIPFYAEISGPKSSDVRNLFYYGEGSNDFVGKSYENKESLCNVEDISLLVSKLNSSIDENMNKWYIDEEYNNSFPIFTRPEPYFIKQGNNIKVYGNGFKIWIKCEGNDTVVCWDKDGNGENNSIIMNADSTLEARFDNNNPIDIFGGSPGILYFDTNIVMLGGTVDNIYGGGDVGEVEKNVVNSTEINIDIQGGNIRGKIDGNGVGNSGKTYGRKILRVSGNPTIGTGDADGVNLDSFTGSKLIISGELTGGEGSIKLIKGSQEHNTIIATADDATFTGKYNVFKFRNLPNNKTIINKENNIIIVDKIYVPPIIYVDKPSINNTDFTYTGTPQSPILIDTDKYTVSVTRETNVGEYTIVVSLKDKVYTRWNDGTNEDLHIKWRINKVDLKVIAKDKSITYGDSPTNAGVSYEGFVNGENQSVLKGDLSYDYNYARYDNVGNYVITPKGYEADNYNIIYTLGTLKVLPKKLSFKWSSPSEFRYDGKVKVMTASIVGIVNNDDVRIASYAHNKTDKVGTYVAKVTGITGTKKDNYTLEGATNISKKWSIVKDKDKEEGKDKNENKDNIKDNGDKNDTSGSNNNQSNGNYANVNMYDKLANNNDYKTDIEGAIEGVKTSDNEIQVELKNGMVISAMGDFEESIRLMVKEIKSKRKEWDWVNSLTKDIGINKGIYDIFFVNSKGVKVNTGRGTKISILSREKLQQADVYYIKTSSEKLKLKSWKEKYTVKFRMIENGYYTLILNDKNNLIEGKGEDVTVVDKDSITDNNDKNTNKDADTINDKDNQDGTEEDKTNVNASKDGDSGSEINTSQDSTNHNIQNTDKQQNDKEDGINWLIIISIILVIIVTIIVSVFILKSFSKDRYE